MAISFPLPGGKSINANFFLYDVEEKGKPFKDNSRKTKLLTIHVKSSQSMTLYSTLRLQYRHHRTTLLTEAKETYPKREGCTTSSHELTRFHVRHYTKNPRV